LLIVETMTNYDLWRKRSIVPKYMQAKEPRDQYMEYNTAASKWMGDKINYSPAKLDHILYGATGGLGTDLARFVTGEESPARALGIRRVDRPTYRGKSINDFYDRQMAFGREYSRAKTAGNVTPAMLDEKARLARAANVLGDLRDLAKGKPKEDRDALQTWITGAARFGLGESDLTEYPNPLAPGRLPADLDKIRQKQVGSILFAATDPQQNKDETRSEWQAAKERQIALLESLGYSQSQAEAILKRYWQSRGWRVYGKKAQSYKDRKDDLGDLF